MLGFFSQRTREGEITRKGEITREGRLQEREDYRKGVITKEHPMAKVASYSGNDAPNRRVIKKKGPGPGSQAQGPGPCNKKKNLAHPSLLSP